MQAHGGQQSAFSKNGFKTRILLTRSAENALATFSSRTLLPFHSMQAVHRRLLFSRVYSMQDVAYPTARNAEHRPNLGLGSATCIKLTNALVALRMVRPLFHLRRRSVEMGKNSRYRVGNGVLTSVPYQGVKAALAQVPSSEC